MFERGFRLRVGFFWDDSPDYEAIGRAMQPILSPPKLYPKGGIWRDLLNSSNLIQKIMIGEPK